MLIREMAAIDACQDQGLVPSLHGQARTLTSHIAAGMQGWSWVNEGKHGQAKWGWVSDEPGSKLVFKVTIVNHESVQASCVRVCIVFTGGQVGVNTRVAGTASMHVQLGPTT